MRHSVGRATLAAAALICVAASAAPQTGYQWHLPAGVVPPPVPADNPMSEVKVELGRRLFYDADLSIDGTTACATCHEQHRAFTEGNATHPGVHEARGRRNVMALANVGYLGPLTWAKPNLKNLEEQFLVPVFGTHPVEMGMTGQEQTLVDRLGTDPCYRDMFAAAFPDQHGQITVPAAAKAIAAFERTLLSFDSPFDRYRRGDSDAISDKAKRGEKLFFGDRLNCASCHAGPNLTDGKFHSIALHGFDNADAHWVSDLGLYEETHDPKDMGLFRTPNLRNVSRTGPYMHDGTVKSLYDAVRRHTALESRDVFIPLADADVVDIVTFLETLTDTGFISDPRFALPKTACGKKL